MLTPRVSFAGRWAVLLLPILAGLWPAPAAAAPISVSSELGAASGFALLALTNGEMIINSATSITGNVGYSAGVVSTTNQKVGTFTGQVFIDSTANVQITAATFMPSGGITTGGAANTLLAQANSDVVAAAAFFGLLTPATSLGAVTGDLDRAATGDVNVFDLTSVDLKEKTWTLHGDANDLFLFRVTGSFDWSGSQMILDGVSPDQVVFYFPNASEININKGTNIFIGTVLAPTGTIDYHNPATLDGALIAHDITVHSGFNISAATQTVPEPASALLVLTGLTVIASVARLTSARHR